MNNCREELIALRKGTKVPEHSGTIGARKICRLWRIDFGMEIPSLKLRWKWDEARLPPISRSSRWD